MSVDPDADTDLEADAADDTRIETDTDVSADIGAANTMRERSGESRIKLWFIFSANRLLVTGLFGLVFFIGFVAIGELAVPTFNTTLYSDDMVDLIFSAMIGAIITGTTLVVTISQLVISQENGPLGEQRARMSNTMDFRDFTAEMTGAPTPADPSAFLYEIVNVTERRADQLRDAITDSPNAQLREEVDQFTESLSENAQQVKERLDGANFGSFEVLNAALDYNYGVKIFHTERIANDYEDSLTEEETAIIERLKSSLSMFGPAREHIKTLYFEWALINLSQLILYTSVPALLVASSMLVFVGGLSYPGTTFGIPNMTLVIGLALTITLTPFFLLIAYVIRIATVAKRTLAIGPFILRDSER